MRRDFDSIKVAADCFVTWATEQMEIVDFEDDQKTLLDVQTELPKKRLQPNPLGSYRIDVFDLIMDTCVTSFQKRFDPDAQGMMANLALLEHRGFDTIHQ